jgi:hypothetical protein
LALHVGNIVSLVTQFETAIIINTIGLATNILDKKAAITASRPTKVILDEMKVRKWCIHWQP